MLGNEISEPLWDRLSQHFEGKTCRGCGVPYERKALHVQPVDDEFVFVRCLHCSGERILPHTPLSFDEYKLRWLEHVAVWPKLDPTTRLVLLTFGATSNREMIVDLDDFDPAPLDLRPDELDDIKSEALRLGLVEEMDDGNLVLSTETIDRSVRATRAR